LTELLVLAVGSPVPGDDLAWHLLDALADGPWAERLAAPGVRACRVDRPGARLIEHLRGARCAVLIDAMRGGGAAGSVRVLAPDDLERSGGTLSSHGLGVAEALALAAALGDLPPRLALIGIEAGDAGDPVAVTPDLVSAVRAALEAVLLGWERGGAVEGGR
jgi:hydrogenase maturation protease